MLHFASKVVFVLSFLFSICVSAKGIVNVYSARHYDTDLALYEDFEEKTGIKVNLIEASSDALIERIVNEGKYSPADILITVDAGRLYRAEQRSIFASINSQVLEERIPKHLRHEDGLWFGLSKRARVIIYNADKGKPEGLNSYEDLAKGEFKGKVCVRSSSNIYNVSLLASLISHQGEEKALDWAKGVMANLRRRPQGNDVANIKAVASGECQISIINTYYLARLVADKNPIASKVAIVYPNQDSTGTHVNISGAGVLKSSPNKQNAIKFIEYLTEPRAQYLFVEGNNEYPVVVNSKITETLRGLGEFKEDTLSTNELGVNQSLAVRLFDQAGWN